MHDFLACVTSVVSLECWIISAFLLLLEMPQKFRTQIVVYCFAWNFGWIFICLSTPIVICWWSQWESWQLVTVLHDEVKWSETLWVTLIELWLRQCSWRILTSSLNGNNGDCVPQLAAQITCRTPVQGVIHTKACYSIVWILTKEVAAL